MTAYPAWARSDVARALLSAIVDERPDSRVVRDDWGQRDQRSFVGPLAGRLRRIRKEWVERNFSNLDRKFAITGVWDAAEAESVLRAETADSLIARVIGEAEQRRAAA